MENQKREFKYFKGLVSEINQKEYTNKKTGQQDKYWQVILTNQETQEKMFSAIFDPKMFDKTPETITELLNTEVQCSYYEDEEQRKHVFMFPEQVQKPNFITEKVLKAQNQYALKLKRINVFQSKDSKNMFVKYTFDPDSVRLLASPTQIQALVTALGITQEDANEKLANSVESKRHLFKNFDWSVITQISSVGPNKNGIQIKPIKMDDGRIFDAIKINQETLSMILLKHFNANNEQKKKKDEIFNEIQKLIETQNIDEIKKMIKPVSDTEVFLDIRSGNVEANKDKVFGRIKAFQPKLK